MMNNYYQLYIDNTYKLAETMLIKFDDIALAMNNGVITKYGIDSVSKYDKTTWKYYQNMSGRYHFSDTVMEIVSLDTLETIEFNKENLAIHTATRKAYEFDTRYYRELLNRFPEQELLIISILYAETNTDFIQNVIDAKNGTIITYKKDLVEVNEYNLISNLQTWIYNYVDRWIVFPFGLSDDLYVPSYLAQLYIQLIPCLINLRLSNCKTNEVHSYHVREYLASHGMLDKYLDVMTKEQALFFYRNILYIQRNAGKRDTFDWLIENIMTKRSLPVYEYTMKHKVDNMLPTEYEPDQLSYFSDPKLKRKTVNFLNVDAEEFTYTLEQANRKVENIAPGNKVYQEEHAESIKQTLEDSVSNVVYTKLLESVLDDYSDAVPYTLESILLNHWLYWSVTEQYHAKITVTLPKTKKWVIMSAKEAYSLFTYAINKAVGNTLETIPQALALRVLKNIVPTVEELHSVTERQFIEDIDLEELVATVPTINPMISIDAFYENALKVYNATLAQYRLASISEYDHHTANLQVATSYLYQDIRLDLSEPNIKYNDWIAQFSLDIADYTKADFYELALSIFNEATGVIDRQAVSVKRIQKAMIDMFTQLSSYSIQFISDVNNSGVELVSTKDVKLLKITTTIHDTDEIELPIFEPLVTNDKEYAKVSYDFFQLDNYENSHSKETSIDHIEINTGVNDYLDNPQTHAILTELPVFDLMAGSNLYTDYHALTTAQKKSLVNLF